MDNTDVILILPGSSLPLAQWTGLEVGEPFGVIAGLKVIDVCFDSKDTVDEVYDLVKIPLEGFCDLFMHENFPSLGFNIILPNPLNHSYVFPMCSQSSSSPRYYIYMPIDNPMIFDANVVLGCEGNMFDMLGGNVDEYVFLGYLRVYDPSIDPYYVFLGDLPRKVIFTIFFNSFYDFCMGFNEVKRILIIFGVILVLHLMLYFLNCGPRSLIDSYVF